MAFLEKNPSSDNVTACNFLRNVQSSIKDSHSLPQKVKQYFKKLTVSKENMKRISQALILSLKYQFLEDNDKHKLLSGSLSFFSSNEYNICWFQFFLANSELWKNTNPNSRKQYFEAWAQSAIEFFQSQSHFLKNIDRLLDAFDKTTAPDEFQIIVINKLITSCDYYEGNL